jgi:hypothetical protein
MKKLLINIVEEQYETLKALKEELGFMTISEVVRKAIFEMGHSVLYSPKAQALRKHRQKYKNK